MIYQIRHLIIRIYYTTRYGIWVSLLFDWILFEDSHFILCWFSLYGTFEKAHIVLICLYGRFEKFVRIPLIIYDCKPMQCSKVFHWCLWLFCSRKSCSTDNYLVYRLYIYVAICLHLMLPRVLISFLGNLLSIVLSCAWQWINYRCTYLGPWITWTI